MELESHLNEMIAGLSNESGSSIEGKADGVIANLEQQRFQKYIDIVKTLKDLKKNKKIRPRIFERNFDKLIKASAVEYKQPLVLLELEREIDLFDQFEARKKTLQDLNIIQKLPKTDRLGIVGVNGLEYPLPTLAEISAQLQLSPERIKLLRTKISQGFDYLVITPFAMKIDQLTECYEQLLVSKHQQGKLFTSQGYPLRLDENAPMAEWEGYVGADQQDGKQKISYYPKQFDKNKHGGYSKDQLLEQSTQNAWHIQIVEDIANPPSSGWGRVIAKRKQLEKNYLPGEYLEILKSGPAYQGEQGFTIEDWLSYALTRLHQTNQQIDEMQALGRFTYNIGSYFPDEGLVSTAHFSYSQSQVFLGGSETQESHYNAAARSSVPLTEVH